MYTCFAELFKQCHEHWGVDEIVGFLRNNGEEMVCTSTMYHFIHWYKREREYCLRHGKHGYRKKKGKKKKTALVNVLLIEERAEEIDKRLVFVHWKVDMIVGPKGEKGGLLTLVEGVLRVIMAQNLQD